jgi:N-sulfoglucosamine sulfohydrolase
LAAAGRLNAVQMTYAAPRRRIEELYDAQSDPHQVNNLADSAGHRGELERLRSELNRWIRQSRDAGFLTEPQVWQRIGDNLTPLELARDADGYPLEALLKAADLVGRRAAWNEQLELLDHPDDGVRYWAAVGLHAAASVGELEEPGVQSVLRVRADASPCVRIELAAARAAMDPSREALAELAEHLDHNRHEIVLHAARTLELLGERARPLLPKMRETLQRARAEEQQGDMPMFIRFSLEAAVEQLAAVMP